MGVWISADKLLTQMNGDWVHYGSWGVKCCRLRAIGCLTLPWLFRVWLLNPPTLFIILTGSKIYGLSIVLKPAAAFLLPFPPLSAELSPALWDLVKTKSHYRGESGLAQPTGNVHSHKCEGLHTVRLCFSQEPWWVWHCPCRLL